MRTRQLSKLLVMIGWGLLTPVVLNDCEADGTPPPEVGGELCMITRQGTSAGFCPLQHTDVHADIAGYVARVHVRQNFINTSREPIEAIYTFPLPDDAAVDDMTMIVGDRRVVGEIKRKEEANQIYNQAKAAGKTASLLDQQRPNIFTQSVANIMPGQNITVDISYVNMLKYQEGAYEFSFPTVVGPRYVPSGGYGTQGRRGAPSAPLQGTGDPGNTSVVTDADKITPPITPRGTHAGHDISMTVDINSAVPLRDIKSVLHPIVIQRLSPTHAVVTLDGRQALPNRDFILRYGVAGNDVQAGLLTYASGDRDGGYFTLILQPSPAPRQQDIASKEMIFVIDQTGSQMGWPIAKAKETIRYCLRNLHRNDTFQLIGFNTDVYPCFRRAVPATRANLATAFKFLEPLEGEGGTDILRSVDYVLRMPTDPARPRIVCYMTDGYVGNDMQIIDYIGKNRGQTRMFPFGVGNSVNRFLIDGMASEGRGAAEYVTLTESGRQAALRFHRRIDSPLLLDISLDWNGLPVEEVFPRHILDVFSAEPIIVKGRYTGAAEGNLVVHGLLRGKPWQQTIHVVFPKSHPEGAALATMWARDKIGDLQASDWLGTQMGKPDPDIAEKITQVALDYHLMSQYTSFVAVEEKIVNPGGQQSTADVPVEMPQGLNYKGFFAAAGQAGAGTYAVTPGSDLHARGGDPLIAVQAAPDEGQVVAILPTGEIKRLVYNALNQRWEARFDIPPYFTQGSYRITVVIVHADHTRKLIQLSYTVRTSPPTGSGQALMETLAVDGREQRSLKLELSASADTERVVALLPWGDRVVLRRTAGDSLNFAGTVEEPDSFTSASSSVTYILTDKAHNHTAIVVDMSQ